MQKLLFLMVFLFLSSGCATKNYGRQGVITDYERANLTCREIDIEKAKAEGFIDQVNKESQFSGKDVLAFLGDFGIGNSLEKSAALESAMQRKEQLISLKAMKKCS